MQHQSDGWRGRCSSHDFPDLEWSQPQQRAKAGKLLVVGGNAHGFAAPGEAYGSSKHAGAGTIRVILPSSLKKLVGQIFPAAEFAPSTTMGDFNSQALEVILGAAAWADTVLLSGDFGNNSETSIMLEQFVQKYSGSLVVAGDTIDSFKHNSDLISRRTGPTGVVLSFSQAQKFLQQEHFSQALVSSVDLLHLVELIHDYSESKPELSLLLCKDDHILVAAAGQVCTTKVADESQLNPTRRAGYASVWLMQNPGKTFEALTVSVQKN